MYTIPRNIPGEKTVSLRGRLYMRGKSLGGEGFLRIGKKRRHVPKIRTFEKLGQIFLDRQTAI